MGGGREWQYHCWKQKQKQALSRPFDLLTEWQHCQGKGEGLLGYMTTPEPGVWSRNLSFLFQNTLFLVLVKSCQTPEITTTGLPLTQ